jgi:futalosine hydrolase
VTYGVAVLMLVAATDRELCGHDGLVCGVGPVEAAAATARALALAPVEAVVHVGIAGARGLDPGVLVVGAAAVYCDLSAEWPVVDRVAPDDMLLAAVRAAFPAAPALPIHTSAAVGGAALAVPGDGVLVEAMEGFGVLRASDRAAVPAIEIRAVSNAIEEDDRRSWDVAAALDALQEALPAVVRAAADASRRRASPE